MLALYTGTSIPHDFASGAQTNDHNSWGAAALMWSLVLDWPLAAIELSAYMQNQLYFYAGLLSCGTLCYVLMILLNFGRCSDGVECDNHADGLPTKSLLLHAIEAIVPGHRR